MVMKPEPTEVAQIQTTAPALHCFLVRASACAILYMRPHPSATCPNPHTSFELRLNLSYSFKAWSC